MIPVRAAFLLSRRRLSEPSAKNYIVRGHINGRIMPAFEAKLGGFQTFEPESSGKAMDLG